MAPGKGAECGREGLAEGPLLHEDTTSLVVCPAIYSALLSFIKP